jgi:Glycosyl hydrolases family 28
MTRTLVPLAVSAFLLACAAQATAQTNELKSFADPAKAGIGTYDIRDFGALGDGHTVSTKAIQSAIDTCTANGGGIVLVPGGEFRTGTIQLKDDVTLRLSPSARLLGSTNREDYLDRDVMISRGVGPGNGNIVLIFAADARNVVIDGRGTIDGDGAVFYTGRGDGSGPRVAGAPAPTNAPNVDRPHLMVFERCERLTVRDVYLTRSAYHCMRILRCQYVRLDGITIFNRVNLNNDGFHFNSCQYVNIANCNIKCQDDACALFGSNQYFTIANCSFSTRWSVFRFGGGSPNHIAVANCLIYETYGCPIKFGGGDCSNMTFDNLIMRDVTGPISITQGGGRGRRGGAGAAGTNDVAAARPRSAIRNISFNNIQATVVLEPQQQEDMPFKPNIRPGERNSCITVNAVGGGIIENITFNNVHVTYAGGGTAEMGALRDVSTNTGEYFGIGVRPAYGLYARGVRGLTLQNVRFDTVDPDLRPAVVLDGVKDVAMDNLSVQGNQGAESALRFINTQDALVTGARLLTPAPVFLAVEGAEGKNVTVDGGDLSKAGKPLTVERGATPDMAKVRE